MLKNKYVINKGFASSEESEMEKLKNYAAKGWLLEDIVYGFYKLRKDTPQDIVYSLDYQVEANEEYFTIFKEAGWDHVVSVKNYIHIFSAKAGTKPIYSDSKSEIEKYTDIRRKTKKGTIYSLIAALVLIGLMVFSVFVFKPLFIIILGIFSIDIFIFLSCFMTYGAYDSRIKQIKKYGKCKKETVNSKRLWKIYAFVSAVFLVNGILDLLHKKYIAVCTIILGVTYMFVSITYFKKSKKSLDCKGV